MSARRPRNKRLPRRNNPLQRLIRTGILVPVILIGLFAMLEYYFPETANDKGWQTDISDGVYVLTGRSNVTDGDTIRLNNQPVRLLGIDAPELNQICSVEGKQFACGQTARSKLIQLIGSQKVSCKTTTKDFYGRWLGLCISGEKDLNRLMIAQGWAVSYGRYQKEETQARRNKRGLWAGDFMPPKEWRKTEPQSNR